MKVYKYQLEIVDHQEVSLRTNSKLLSVANQQGVIVLYALVDPDAEGDQTYDIYIHGTGHDVVDPEAEFIGTVPMLNASLMFHVFGKPRK